MNEYLNALAQGARLSAGTYNDVVANCINTPASPRATFAPRTCGFRTTASRPSFCAAAAWRWGAYDARYTSYTLDRLAERPDFDATNSAIEAGYVATGNAYMRQALGYRTSLVYYPTINVFRQWDWKHNGALPTNTAQDLASAMTFNPNLRVFSANGYYDFATPFFTTVYTLNHLNIPSQLQANISYGFYESGHMVYLHEPALAQFHNDLEHWYEATLRAGR